MSEYIQSQVHFWTTAPNVNALDPSVYQVGIKQVCIVILLLLLSDWRDLFLVSK